VSAGEIDQGSKKMKVNVQAIGLTNLYGALRRNEEVQVEFSGKTTRELIDALLETYGTNVRKALLNENGDFNPRIRVFLNGVIYPVETVMGAIPKAGDTLIFKAPS
jgi:hypothetical protein